MHSTSANACLAAAAQTPYLHKSLPVPVDGMLSDGISAHPIAEAVTVAAEVEILTDTKSLWEVAIDARIITMLRGSYLGTRIRIEPRGVSSCDGFPRAGDMHKRRIIAAHRHAYCLPENVCQIRAQLLQSLQFAFNSEQHRASPDSRELFDRSWEELESWTGFSDDIKAYGAG